jgi:phage shock protein A
MMQLFKRLKNAKRIVQPIDPERAYRRALDAHAERHEELRRAAAGALYVQFRLEADLLELRAEIARVHSVIRNLVRAGNESRALALIAEKQRLAAELERRENELAEMRGDADDATAQVVASAGERRNLQREKLRTIAAISVARAKKKIADLRAQAAAHERELEEVRAEVLRLEGESHLARELDGDVLARELGPGFDIDHAKTELARIRARCA